MTSTRSRCRAALGLAVAALGLFPIVGCGGTSAPIAADPDAAKQTLERALASWKKGEPADSLKDAKPSIYVSDMKWSKGAKLSKYEVEVPSKPSGAQQKFRVTLWLTDAQGKEKKDVAQYEVGTDPVYTVVRTLFE